MFEYDQEIVEALLSENDDFKRMYQKHGELKDRVHGAHTGTSAMDDFSLENIKKEKLMLKDRMAAMIEDYKREHA